MDRDLKYWLRWLAVLPGGLLGGLLLLFPLRLVLVNTLRGFVEPYPEMPERLLTPFVVAAGFVWLGARIAPERKTETAVALFGVWLFVVGASVALALANANVGGQSFYLRGGGIAPLLGVVGSVVGLLVARREARIGGALAAAVLFAASLPVAAAAQDSTDIAIEGQALRLGMTRAAVDTALAGCCKTDGSADSTFVYSKTGPPFRIVGALWFVDGRLSRVRRDRAQSTDQQAVELALSLFRVIDESSGSAPTPARVQAETSEMANGTKRTVRISFDNGKSIAVSVNLADDQRLGRSVDISEERTR